MRLVDFSEFRDDPHSDVTILESSAFTLIDGQWSIGEVGAVVRHRGEPVIEVPTLDRNSSDEYLVHRALSDTGAFDRLFDRYWDRIVRYCYYRLGSWIDAEDAAQRVVVKYTKGLAGFHFRGDPNAFQRWVFTLARNETIDSYRHEQRKREVALPERSSLIYPGPTPEEEAMLAATHGWLRELFALLPPAQREVMEYISADLTTPEIARLLDKREENIRQLISRARVGLSALMRESGERNG